MCFGKQAPSHPIPEHGMGSRTTGYIARRLAGAACRVSQACDHTDVCACIRGLIAAGAAIDLSAWMEVPQNGFWAGRFFPISPASGRYGRGTPNRFNTPSPVRHLVPGEKRFVGKRIGKTLIEIDHDFPDTALLRLNMLSSKFWPIGLLPRQ
ncbi:hypothetical protein GOB13_03745 [Sinorhizobium meliloti]|nr:hypothetical protein CDO23_29905 [Sinorhizobium meliloti]MDW9665415.1 hypothetical protein [Sinorhizobium meliloti]MDW9801467.1 hypothetical protein [Sinorhizobium meliloti]MDX0005253.1 hypothetical protein [Sinorhizobium meliloti]MDX0062360.1 hypothetical protein [Sinorhizobium meliloti]